MTVIDAALATYLEGVPAQYISTADAGTNPIIGRAWGLRVTDGHTVRAVVGADASTVANLETTSRAALVVADVATYRSVQVKGTLVAVEPATATDHVIYQGYQREFTAALRSAGRTTPMDEVWPASIITVTIDVDAVFDQTPGPGAGRAMTGPS